MFIDTNKTPLLSLETFSVCEIEEPQDVLCVCVTAAVMSSW